MSIGGDSMKSITIKIPMRIAIDMDERGRLNPDYLTGFIVTHLDMVKTIVKRPINELTYTYTCKINKDLHKSIKLLSIENDMPMNELIGRLLNYYYKR